MANLAIGFTPASNTVTSACGTMLLSCAAQKHPAAPAPMMATRFILYLRMILDMNIPLRVGDFDAVGLKGVIDGFLGLGGEGVVGFHGGK